MPQNRSVQAQEFGISMKKKLHWASVVCVSNNCKNVFACKEPQGKFCFSELMSYEWHASYPQSIKILSEGVF